jgi:hypothetical protein
MIANASAAPTAADSGGVRWPRRLLLAIHLVASLGFLGSSLGVLVLTISGADGTAARDVYPAAQMLTVWLVEPLAIAAVVTGVTQALSSRYGLTKYWWVVIKLVITAVLAVVVMATLYPRIADAAGAALGLSAQPITAAERTRIAVSWPILCLLLAANALLGVSKPGWRLARRRGTGQATELSTRSDSSAR